MGLGLHRPFAESAGPWQAEGGAAVCMVRAAIEGGVGSKTTRGQHLVSAHQATLGKWL